MLLRLRLLMFFHMFCAGAIAPIFNLYLLEECGFSGMEVGLILASGYIAMMIGLLTLSTVSDRWLSAERLYLVLLIITVAGIIGLISTQVFIAVLLCFIVYSSCSGPGIGILESICFLRLLNQRRDDYGQVRVFSTFGWMSVGLVVFAADRWFLEPDADTSLYRLIFLLAIVACVMNLINISGMPKRAIDPMVGEKERHWRRSLALFKQPKVMLIVCCAFLTCFLDRFFFFFAAPYLNELGLAHNKILLFLSTAQLLEVPALFILGSLIRRIGFGWIIAIGALMHITRFACMAYGETLASALIGTLCHGAGFAFLTVVLAMLFERLCPRENLSGAYLLYSLLSAGLSGIVSSSLGGALLDSGLDFRGIWSVPFVLSFILMGTALWRLKPGWHSPR